MCVWSMNSEGSDDTAQMCRVVRAFAVHLRDKYPSHISWLKQAILNKSENATRNFFYNLFK